MQGLFPSQFSGTWRAACVRLFRAQGPVGHLDRLTATLGAFAGIFVTGVIGHWWLGPETHLPLLLAPLGASAVLLFAVPASPLAQPWAVLGGNILSALIGIACAHIIPVPLIAAAMAVALAIGCMSLLRCLHPPGGAVALTAVVGGPAVLAAGWSFALVPVAMSSAILLFMAIIVHKLSKRTYPHHVDAAPQASAHDTRDIPAEERVGVGTQDIEAALNDYGDLLDIGQDDLAQIYRQAEERAHHRQHGEIQCGQIMSRDLILAYEEETPDTVRQRMIDHHLFTLPVIRSTGEVAGIVTAIDFPANASSPVGTIMRPAFCIMTPESPIESLFPALLRDPCHEALVVDHDARLIGIITRTDLLAALWRAPASVRQSSPLP